MTHIDPNVYAALTRAMENEDPRWFAHTTGPRLVNHPADKGGLTRGGITAKNWGKHLGLDRPATEAELLAITTDEAIGWYYATFVVAPGFEHIPDQTLRALCIDWSFTSGPDDPWRAVQFSLKSRGYYGGHVDGLPGRQTKAALLADREPTVTYRDVFITRIKFYLDLGLNDPDVQHFIRTHRTSQLWNVKGWLSRSLEYAP